MNPEFSVEKIRAAVPALLGWYDVNKRAMAWRDEVSPYRTWISEIMLQQTRVETVHGYFERFMEALPDIGALAAADEETLYKLWEGLGYYSRVRNLKKAAEIVVKDFGGFLPEDPENLQKLPGIGAYTAGAIASIAYGLPRAAVDGNVVRVFARFLDIRQDFSDEKGKRALARAIEAAMPPDRCGDYTQALMELGALVCSPGMPHCAHCPIQSMCAGFAAGSAPSLPILPPKKAKKSVRMSVYDLWDEQGNRLLHKRPSKGLLAGLWEPWHTEGWLTEAESKEALQPFELLSLAPLGDYTHIFTHVKWLMRGWRAVVRQVPDGFVRVGPGDQTHALPRAFAALTEKEEKS